MSARDGRTQDVAHGGVRVPDAHHQPARAVPEPAPHHRHHAGPAHGLTQPLQRVDANKVPAGGRSGISAAVRRRMQGRGVRAECSGDAHQME